MEEKAFDAYFQELKLKKESVYTLPYPKHTFLLYLLENQEVVLHGSSVLHIDTLQPRLARCNSKAFGNLFGIYASTNSIVPIMFAIAQGSIKMEYSLSGNGRNATGNLYRFDLQVYGTANFSFGTGMVYILDKKGFSQGRDEEAGLINEWISLQPTSPIAQLEVNRSDFPF